MHTLRIELVFVLAPHTGELDLVDAEIAWGYFYSTHAPIFSEIFLFRLFSGNNQGEPTRGL